MGGEEEACGLEMWNGVRHYFSAGRTWRTGGSGGVSQAAASLVRIAAEGNFYVCQYVGVEGMLFS